MKRAIGLALTWAVSLSLLLSGSASAAHTVFPAGSPFTGGTDVITDFPTCGSVPFLVGPVGLLNDGAHFFVDDFCTHFNDPTQNSTTYRFPVTGGSALSPQASVQNGLTHGITVAGGVYYGLSDGGDSFLPSGLYRFDPSTLAVTGPIATFPGIRGGPFGIAVDPLTGDLYVSSDGGIFRVQNPSGTPTVTTFACCSFFDGLAFTTDGSRLYAARPGDQHVVGFDRSGNIVMDVNDSPHGPDGIAVAEANRVVSTSSGSLDVSNNVFVNANDGTIERIDVNNGNALSVAAGGGSRGDFATVGPDDCLYVTQSSTIEKLSPCFFQPTTATPPSAKVNVRWHYSANGSAGGWSTTETVSPTTGAISIGPQAMEGNLIVHTNDTLRVGYDFTMPGQHPPTTLHFAQTTATFQWVCATGPGSGTLVVPIQNEAYTDAQNNPSWYPTGDQQSPLVYQGQATIPPNPCIDGAISLRQGGTFKSTVLI